MLYFQGVEEVPQYWKIAFPCIKRWSRRIAFTSLRYGFLYFLVVFILVSHHNSKSSLFWVICLVCYQWLTFLSFSTIDYVGINILFLPCNFIFDAFLIHCIASTNGNDKINFKRVSIDEETWYDLEGFTD